jgi:hypothetical protein
MEEPVHHKRYRVAWEAYLDPDTPEDCIPALQKEMDLAQNHFSFEEFQVFKKTLPGYEEEWSRLENEILQKLKSLGFLYGS